MKTLPPGRSALLLLAAAGLGLAALAGTAEAGTLNVANNGQDSTTCGAAASPCRSISQAIANAVAGDRIVVGPGRYGDLDGSGTFTPATGEEAAEVGSGMIKVDKAVTIESRAGAGATVLDAGGASSLGVVWIQSSGVVFGRAKKGFTLTGGDYFGLGTSGSGVTIAGNLATGNRGAGFRVDASGSTLTGNLASDNGGDGFLLPQASSSGHLLTGNLATGNRSGFIIAGSDHRLSGNVASNNGNTGFLLLGTGHALTGSLAASNNLVGIHVLSGTGHTVTGNGVYGNQAGGILAEVTAVTITQNNIMGNDPTSNCGFVNTSGGAITVPGNFWGAPGGPGADPADNVCNMFGSTTTVAPFATKEFKAKAKPLF